jgi:succinate dehydrogenase/fumarate reductase flavoprotein subunit
VEEVCVQQEIVKADVLCIGGGIVGLMAAMRASELGAKAVVVEKGNTLHSGNGGAGNDHFLCYIPQVHGTDIDGFIEAAIMETQLAEHYRDMGMNRLRTYMKMSFDMVRLWDSWGIPMKYKGDYEFAGHAFPGRPLSHLKYEGQRQKIVLTEQALRRGVEILNRVMVCDLFSGDCPIAIGIHTRDDKVIVFQAKSIVLGTGTAIRLYPSPTPGWFSNNGRPASLTGDGRVMAYRAGAELAAVEMPRLHAGPKYFVRAGQATWIGVYRDPYGKPIGPFVTEPDRRYGDITPEVSKGIFRDYAKSGRGPVYIDGSGMSDEDYEYMMHWLTHEGNVALINHLKEEGIDHRRNPVEFMTYERGCYGKVLVNDEGETSVRGLYAAGDEVGLGISHAAVFGWIVGENAARYAQKVDLPRLESVEARLEEKKRLFSEIRSREVGPDWREVNIALQQIMYDYAGNIRSEALLEAGRSHLLRLKEKAYSMVMAKNQHELARSLEVLNLLDLGELVFVAANERKETRGTHIRSDYPLTNPQMNKLLVVRRTDDKPVTQWRK